MATDVNDPNLVAVSFIRSGLTIGGQVHLEGTYAYVKRSLAELDEDAQVAKLGHVYFRPGIRRGFPPASQTYLSPEFRERIARDTTGPRPSAAPETAPAPAPQEEPEAIGMVQGVVGQTTTPEAVPEPFAAVQSDVESPDPDAESAFEGTIGMSDADLRALLARMDDEDVTRFIAWERARPEPRTEILSELEG